MTLKLHCFGESGNSYKAALALELSELDWEPVFVDFFKGEPHSEAYRTLNSMGEAPVLIDGEKRVAQSGAIQQYITDKSGKFGGTGDDHYEVLRWVLWDNHKLSSMCWNLIVPSHRSITGVQGDELIGTHGDHPEEGAIEDTTAEPIGPSH